VTVADGGAVPLPLAGIRVVDVTRFVAGPLATFFLASMGAEVIAVERPGGETSRMLPPFGKPGGGSSPTPVDGGMSIPYLKRARGKRSVSIALDQADGRALVARLAAVADVFVENSRPGVMARLGLGFDALRAANPRLVYASISGFGQTGPRAGAPAMDQAVQAASGLMAKTGFADGPPIRSGAAVGDFASAAFAAMGVLGALRQRDRSGRGQHVDLSMLDVLTALVWDEPVDHYADAGLPVRTGNADPRGAPINVYPTSDGWVAVTTTTNEQWQQLVLLMGRPEWATSMPTVRDRAGNGPEIDAAFAAWSRTLPSTEAERVLVDIGIAAAAVRDPVAARDDAQLAHRRLLEPLQHPAAAGAATGFLGPRLPIDFEGRAAELPPAEPLGASTDAVLGSWLGVDGTELARLRASGVVASAS
jgi:crotonobetainyl-CoA:carnitine CoA-transferase CaiB-like acyl-CoA transferase